MNYARKVDAIQPSCVKLWRKFGKEVILTHKQGGGCPDCFVLHRSIWLAVELKSGEKAKLKKSQEDLAERVKAKGGILYVIRSIEEAAKLIGVNL